MMHDQDSSRQLARLIRSRRSVRRFAGRPVSDREIETLLEAARWAPSGLNNQPWRFVIIRDGKLRQEIATLTKYGKIIENAPVSIAVFLDNQSLYHREKDIQGIGAALQNILLMAHGLGLGAVWLGEILKNAKRVGELLELPTRYELMAVVAVGHPDPDHKPPVKERRPLAELVLKRL
ncbi:MAG: nitroreductase family protein [Deltaproteobacteria bacterium]|nr:nitroreductase family protein [Deltaproteobacteria bacterium]